MDQVFAIPAFKDNYIWALHDSARRHVVVVDPGDAAPVMEYLERQACPLAAILVTHHHWDHTGGIKTLLEHHDVPVYGPAGEDVPGCTTALREGDRVALDALGLEFEVFDIPGHTAGHIAYYGAGMLFCGDTLFAGGCGRLFEGTPAQMYASLSKLAALPEATRVYCAHEYTEANLRFARGVEPGNEALAARLQEVQHLRSEGRITLPSRIGLELETNPFLRTKEVSVIESAEAHTAKQLSSPVDVFAAVRAWKDG